MNQIVTETVLKRIAKSSLLPFLCCGHVGIATVLRFVPITEMNSIHCDVQELNYKLGNLNPFSGQSIVPYHLISYQLILK